MSTILACRRLSRDTTRLSGRCAGCLPSGVLRPDGPKCVVDDQVRSLIKDLGCRRVFRGCRAGPHILANRLRHQLTDCVNGHVTNNNNGIPVIVGNRFSVIHRTSIASDTCHRTLRSGSFVVSPINQSISASSTRNPSVTNLRVSPAGSLKRNCLSQPWWKHDAMDSTVRV